MLLQESLNSLIQLVVILLICLIIWFFMARRKSGFLKWIGLYAPTGKSMIIALITFVLWSAITLLLYTQPALQEAASGDNTIAGTLAKKGFSLEIIFVILVVAGIKTALAEEIFFRGLIAKRLINALGFWPGNIIQALIFGGIHLVIFVLPDAPAPTPLLITGIFIFPSISGGLMGYINERKGNGSILPGWLMHALGNAISYPVLAFMV